MKFLNSAYKMLTQAGYDTPPLSPRIKYEETGETLYRVFQFDFSANPLLDKDGNNEYDASDLGMYIEGIDCDTVSTAVSKSGFKNWIAINLNAPPKAPYQRMQTLSHELFHAFQDAYPMFGSNCVDSVKTPPGWITEGLERWFDFYLDGEQLVLLSSAAVTQKIVRKVKKKWGQNIVSWIDLDTGIPTPRMIPLDEQYLEAALNAGDAGQQYLEGQPGSEPVLLTTLGAKPLVVSVGWISHRQVLRLHEADEQLMAYTEAYDEKQAKLAKEVSSKQRKADREARMLRMQVAEAEAAGMSLEEYNALSNSEQKKALIRNDGFEQLMKTMTQESQDWQAKQGAQQTMPSQPSAMPQDMNAQFAAAMAKVQEQMANDPNMTPEMRAQMAAIMGQMGQGGRVTGMPGLPGAQPSAGLPKMLLARRMHPKTH